MSRRMRPHYADPRGTIVENRAGYAILAEGTTVPSDTGAGYSTGCIFIHTDGGNNTALYVNEGTATSCDFNLIAVDVGLDLTGLLATATEINRAADVSTRIVTTTVALAITEALHDGKTVVLNNATGFACTLPAMTGSGARFRFVVNTTVTTPSHTIVATGAHLVGSIFMVNDTAAGTVFTANSISANATPITTITLDGTTTGGRKGDWIEVEDIATNLGAVRGMVSASGTEATPFS
jgi:hypothetical protein